ncbi:hypothetical protein SPRG_15590 [Saprolegnia parasitica CBS 223.65]|uniref:Ricin B lectin domain-containing protein n=1 Tax=Saprolegnia parasitica (strain CBS 223.65) TaxID=695850 RepID=A0A067BJR5_SAPPC|nr:hypothetical protein SPRG_15590 [Saprolegnia parasitica CBS 223.65]KDO18423.1 hypothetical protein SPRG_15590 [Saprolegnia parasitica CBS 223.65]|eukprot:XP_012210873.1 hypothetical protein SPRG_15590 [Saprolegnia parasitica CBS 223.65]
MQLAYALLGCMASAIASVTATNACGDMPTPTTPAPTTPAPSTPAPFSLCKTLTDGKVIYLKADNGRGLGYCGGCQVGGYPYPARTGEWAQPVHIRIVPGGKMALQSEYGSQYWSRCADCNPSNKPNQVVLRYTSFDASNTTHWFCEDVSETQVRFKDVDGSYLTRDAESPPALYGNLITSLPWNAAAPEPQKWTVSA